MGIRDLVKKKDRLGDGDGAYGETLNRLTAGPEFTFIRSDTHTQEVIHPPSTPIGTAQDGGGGDYLQAKSPPSSRARRSLDVFKSRSRGNSASSVASASDSNTTNTNDSNDSDNPKRRMSLSHRLHLSRSSTTGRRQQQQEHHHRHILPRRDSKAATSEYVPDNLPQINVTADEDGGGSRTGGGGPGAAAAAEVEVQWEARATMLAEETSRRSRSASVSPAASPAWELPALDFGAGAGDRRSVLRTGFGTGSVSGSGSGSGPNGAGGGGPASGVVSSKAIDADIQEAIRLHEEGDLERSTALFGRLADPDGGANNPLSQVLYGLALRHGWGCEPDPERAVSYLSAAASNAARVETMALKAGVKRGGAAKGELVLAIFELANCFRHGWGTPKDPVAAKQYYETAANLGDTDAMNEVAWCYLEGFGCKKDKFAAARYYRLAEKHGSKTLGNTWIWKDKYDPDGGKKKK